MKGFKADLHIHTCLSPCADLDMSPKNIVQQAKNKGIDIIGICDHNSAENVPAVLKNAEGIGIKVIGGMEITTKEEVHILAFFDSLTDIFYLQEIVYKDLPEDKNGKISEEQVIANEEDEVIGFNKKLLIGAAGITVEKFVELIHKRNGLAIASHIDRDAFSIIGQLGFIPDGVYFDALELINPDKTNIISVKRKSDAIFVNFSDAHYLWDVGKRYTTFLMNDMTFKEIRMCLKGENYRRVII